MSAHWSSKLVKLHACQEAVDYAKEHKTLQSAWDACERGDWMLWLLGKLSGKPESQSRRDLVLMACACARLSLKHLPQNEKRPLLAIQTAERWAKREKEVSLDDVRNAAAAADAADDAAYAAHAARKHTLSKCADIVRKMHSKAPVLK